MLDSLQENVSCVFISRHFAYSDWVYNVRITISGLDISKGEEDTTYHITRPRQYHDYGHKRHKIPYHDIATELIILQKYVHIHVYYIHILNTCIYIYIYMLKPSFGREGCWLLILTRLDAQVLAQNMVRTLVFPKPEVENGGDFYVGTCWMIFCRMIDIICCLFGCWICFDDFLWWLISIHPCYAMGWTSNTKKTEKFLDSSSVLPQCSRDVHSPRLKNQQQIRSADPSMEQPADIKLTRDDKPERKFFENPLTWYLGV